MDDDNLNEYNSQVNYEVISMGEKNPALHSPSATYDLYFYQTKETLSDPEVYRYFIKNIESRFRRSKEYKTYKAYLMGLGFDHCQIMGNIEATDGVDIELHHNIINLFDICILITEHILNTVGYVSTFDVIQLLINEHFSNRIPCTFLSVTAHQMFTNNPEAYIPPDMTFGKWWELLAKYKYGITYNIAMKINKYIQKYRNQIPTNIQVQLNEQILNFSSYNDFAEEVNSIEVQSTFPMRDNNKYYLEGDIYND